MRQMTSEVDGALSDGRILICDRDPKWSRGVRQLLETAGVRVIRTPFRAPNCNAHAERFVRSIKEECVDRLIPLVGRRHINRAVLMASFTRWHGPSTSRTVGTCCGHGDVEAKNENSTLNGDFFIGRAAAVPRCLRGGAVC